MPTSYETGWDYDQTDKTWRAPTPTVIPQDARAQANSILPVGMIAPYIGTAAPVGWLLCDGASFSSATYPALASLLGGTATPNLKGRVIAGYDAAQTEFNTLKGTGGLKTLTTNEMPTHTHIENAHNHAYSNAWPNSPADGGSDINRYHVALGTPNDHGLGTASTTPTLQNAGNGAAGGNMPPYMTLNYIIKAA